MTDRRPSDLSDDLTPEPSIDSDSMAGGFQQTTPERPGRAGRRWLLPLGAAVLVSAVVAGTALVVSTVGGDTPTSAPGVLATTTSARPSDQDPQPSEHQLARANAVLARWERLVGASSYVPVAVKPPSRPGDSSSATPPCRSYRPRSQRPQSDQHRTTQSIRSTRPESIQPNSPRTAAP